MFWNTNGSSPLTGMSKITDQLGAVFKCRFEDCLKKPLNWRMIDALETLDEKELEQQVNRKSGDNGAATDEGTEKRGSKG